MSLTKFEKISGVILAITLFLITLSSTYFFLGELGISVLQWIAFNSCSPLSFIYIICFVIFMITKKSIFLLIPFLPIYFLGTISMFFIPWNELTVMAHIGHVIMTLNLIWVIYVILKHKNYKSLGIGLLLSILIFVPYIGYVQTYNQIHAEEINQIF